MAIGEGGEGKEEGGGERRGKSFSVFLGNLFYFPVWSLRRDKCPIRGRVYGLACVTGVRGSGDDGRAREPRTHRDLLTGSFTAPSRPLPANHT